ncbi:hypothetical protein [Longimicrobium sp.]|uniref:hypothetical protein n=1 Tax=Longimicrobium sp. TaxID=2029185 RepID=UPI002C0FFB0E|nr:hypothetical protein [Longimicrobium sp.]HSU14339.1 hypothetical protein [Longimicrobium sp.]
MTLHTDGSPAPTRRVEIHVTPARAVPEPPHPLDSILPSSLWAGLPATLAVMAAGVYITRSPLAGIFGGMCFAGLCWALALLVNLGSPARSARAPVFAAAVMLPLAGAMCLHARSRWAQYDADVTALTARSGPQFVARLIGDAPFLYRIPTIHAMRLCADDAYAYGQFVTGQYGLNDGLGVPGWPTDDYMAHPSRYPRVSEWFTSFGHASEALRRSFGEYFIERGEAHFREAGIPAPVVKEIVRGMREALRTPDATRSFDAMDRFAAAGLALDNVLRAEEIQAQQSWSYRVRFRDEGAAGEVNRRIEALKEAQRQLAEYDTPGQQPAPSAAP